jgi:protein YibB
MEEITLVTDFFDIGRGQDKNKDLRRTAQRYFDEFKRWARIQNTLVVYTDSDSAEIIKGIRAEYGLGEKTIIIQIDNLFELVPDLLPKLEKISHNKDFLNFRYLPEASSNNPKYDYLWMMKYYFMKDAYERGLLSENVVWMDFGFDHGGITYSDAEDYNFLWEYDFKNKIHISCLHDPDSVIGLQSLQFQDDCVMGCMYGLSRELVPTFWHLVEDAMNALLMLDCMDDDQQLVLMAYKARPEIFEVHVTDWQMIMKEMGATHMKVREKLPMQAQAENPYKKMLRIAVRKIVPNKNDPKHAFAKRCYNAAIRVYGK